MSDYYFAEPEHQLEINLDSKRKELIAMLDVCEQNECNKCLLVKCKCNQPKTDNDIPSNKNDSQVTINSEPCSNSNKDVSPQKTILTKSKLENGLTISTPVKKPITQDIEKWMGTSKLLQKYREKVALNQRKSLVTIESVRPADLPLKTLQRSSILNSSNYLPRSTSNHLQGSHLMYSSNAMNGLNLRDGLDYVNNHFESLLKHFNQSSDAKVVYSSSKLGAACNKQVRPSYSYF